VQDTAALQLGKKESKHNAETPDQRMCLTSKTTQWLASRHSHSAVMLAKLVAQNNSKRVHTGCATQLRRSAGYVITGRVSRCTALHAVGPMQDLQPNQTFAYWLLAPFMLGEQLGELARQAKALQRHNDSQSLDTSHSPLLDKRSERQPGTQAAKCSILFFGLPGGPESYWLATHDSVRKTQQPGA
jgi:hypothetical protein